VCFDPEIWGLQLCFGGYICILGVFEALKEFGENCD
jgi:hypothetical protein